MSEKTTKTRLADRQRGDTDWARIDATTENALEREIADDPDSDVGHLDWAKAELVMPKRKDAISMRVDPEVLAWFKSQGKGYLTRMNAVLRQYYEAHRDEQSRMTSSGE